MSYWCVGLILLIIIFFVANLLYKVMVHGNVTTASISKTTKKENELNFRIVDCWSRFWICLIFSGWFGLRYWICTYNSCGLLKLKMFNYLCNPNIIKKEKSVDPSPVDPFLPFFLLTKRKWVKINHLKFVINLTR